MVNHFSELDWIDYLKSKVSVDRSVLTGIGDDCAVVSLKGDKCLFKSDMFIEGIHFDPKRISFSAIGKRAVARVLSDFAACGGFPLYIGASVAAPCEPGCKKLKQILSGILSMARKHNFSLIGGDTSKTKKIFIDIWGMAKAQRPVLRSGAKAGDLIFVTGRLGRRKFNEPFEPRIKESKFLVENFKLNSMIDISDGFIMDLYRIIKASQKGAVIFSDKVPLTNGSSDLYRGEDYELIFTVDKKEKKIKSLKKRFSLVGEIFSEDKGFKIAIKNKFKDVLLKGYGHF